MRSYSLKALMVLYAGSFLLFAGAKGQGDDFVVRAEAYLNGLQSWSSSFTQTLSDGSSVRGRIWVKRPGLLRLDYDAPSTAKLFIHDDWVVQHDERLNETTHIPLNRTPAGFFLRKKINLEGNVKIHNIRKDKRHTYVKVSQKDSEDSGAIVLVFRNRPLTLMAWYIIDEARNVTEITLDNIVKGDEKPKSWFVFHAKLPQLQHNH